MIGAPALAANAALRAGAGLATVAVPRSIQLAVATLCPCATSVPLAESATGTIDPAAVRRQLRAAGFPGPAAPANVVAAGPGLGRGNARFDRSWLDLLLDFVRAGVALVVDADGLNALHMAGGRSERGWNTVGLRRTVLTPHPGELARLLDTTTRAVQADREGSALRTARAMHRPDLANDDRPVVVLKGARTVVTDGSRLYVNKTGNPGMATGGSGDVLTGVIAGLIAQGLTCFEAAVLGVHLHGLGGDLAAAELGQAPLMASDLLEYLAAACRSIG